MVNILISTYNGELYIEEQLDSILNQTYKDYHIYIRDDGSDDNTVSVIKHYIESKQLQNIITLEIGANIGFCESFFALLRMSSKGDYWSFCDQDDVWYEDKLERSLEWMEKQHVQDIPLLYHSGIEVGNSDLSKKRPNPIPQFDYHFYNSITSNIFSGFAITINRALYEQLVKADAAQIKYHDWFTAMIAAAFGKYHLSSHVTAIHRIHGNNESPESVLKTIPSGIKLLKGDLFYTRNAREFMRLYGTRLSNDDREILTWFLNEHYSLKQSLKKAFYKRRWNPRLSVEIIIRVLMLIGKI